MTPEVGGGSERTGPRGGRRGCEDRGRKVRLVKKQVVSFYPTINQLETSFGLAVEKHF